MNFNKVNTTFSYHSHQKIEQDRYLEDSPMFSLGDYTGN